MKQTECQAFESLLFMNEVNVNEVNQKFIILYEVNLVFFLGKSGDCSGAIFMPCMGPTVEG